MDQRLYDRALTLLAHRPRSIVELRRKLLQKGDAADVEEVVARLRDQQLLDDADFARDFARSRIVAAGTSRRRIAQELGRQGVSREVAERAIEDLEEAEGLDSAAAVQRVAEKKWKTLLDLDEFTRRRRLYAFLARRGFDPDEIRGVMNTIGEDVES
jgi:regulatory protein